MTAFFFYAFITLSITFVVANTVPADKNITAQVLAIIDIIVLVFHNQDACS